MKQRILLIVAVLLIAAPAFATVNISAVQSDVNKITISYSCSAGEAVRAFALNLSIGSSNNSMLFSDVNTMGDFNRGESNKPGGGYGIFPGQFSRQIDPGNPNWSALFYTPFAPDGSVDSNGTGFGMRTAIAELGTLYTGANAPGTSGTLFSIRWDPNGKTTDTLTVSANTIRGGVVLESGSAATTNLPISIPIGGPSNITVSGRIIGSAAPKDTAGIQDITLRGFPGGDVNTDASGNYSVTIPVGSYTVNVLDVYNQWTLVPSSFNCGSVNLVQNVTGTATECLNAHDPGYSAWKGTPWNKPACWCNRRQCRGDVGGTKAGFWVYSSDLNTFKSAYGKSDTVLATVPNGICADLDHVKSGFRVYSNDLTIIKAYYGKADALVPECNLAPVIVKVNKWNN